VRREIILIVRPLGSARLIGSDRPTDIATTYHATLSRELGEQADLNPAHGFLLPKTETLRDKWNRAHCQPLIVRFSGNRPRFYPRRRTSGARGGMSGAAIPIDATIDRSIF